jgi:hypothetical protein
VNWTLLDDAVSKRFALSNVKAARLIDALETVRRVAKKGRMVPLDPLLSSWRLIADGRARVVQLQACVEDLEDAQRASLALIDQSRSLLATVDKVVVDMAGGLRFVSGDQRAQAIPH